MFKNQTGQVIVVLLLVMLLGLSIGLVVTQRSINDVSTSTQTEQASRAFSAAEAGLEKALSNPATTTDTNITIPQEFFNNQSKADVVISDFLPNPGQAFEYLTPISKEMVAQFWLSNPSSPTVAKFLGGNSLDVYFGNPTQPAINSPQADDIPAVEIRLISFNPANFNYTYEQIRYVDPLNNRALRSNFENCNSPNTPINTTNSLTTSTTRSFYCRYRMTTDPNLIPVMLRVRLLYTNTPQMIAVQPLNGQSLPVQASIYRSTGKSGQSQKIITASKVKNVLPFFLDYAVFSISDVSK